MSQLWPHSPKNNASFSVLWHIFPVIVGPWPWEAGRPGWFIEDLPASVLNPAGRARSSSHPWQQQEQEQQAEASHDLRMALPAPQNLRGSSLQVQWPPLAGSHYRQVCHSQKDCVTGRHVLKLQLAKILKWFFFLILSEQRRVQFFFFNSCNRIFEVYEYFPGLIMCSD